MNTSQTEVRDPLFIGKKEAFKTNENNKVYFKSVGIMMLLTMKMRKILITK